jgi:hypothetical protein
VSVLYRRAFSGLLLGIAGITTVRAQTLYHCKAGATTVFQDTPCASDQKRVLSDADVREARRKADEDARKAEAKRVQAEAEGAESQARERAKAICGERYGKWPQIGQAASQVRACFAEPDKRNATTTANGTQEQWVYDRLGYVYINERGVVRATQRHQ